MPNQTPWTQAAALFQPEDHVKRQYIKADWGAASSTLTGAHVVPPAVAAVRPLRRARAQQARTRYRAR